MATMLTCGHMLNIHQDLFKNIKHDEFDEFEHVTNNNFIISPELDLYKNKSNLVKTLHDKIFLFLCYSLFLSDPSLFTLGESRYKKESTDLLEKYDIPYNVKEILYNTNKYLYSNIERNFILLDTIEDISHIIKNKYNLNLVLSPNLKENIIYLAKTAYVSNITTMSTIHNFIISHYDNYYNGLEEFLCDKNFSVLLEISVKQNVHNYQLDNDLYRAYIYVNLDLHESSIEGSHKFDEAILVSKVSSDINKKEQLANNANFFYELSKKIPYCNTLEDGLSFWAYYLEMKRNEVIV